MKANNIEKLLVVIYKAIRQRSIVKFPFESESGNIGDRTIKPYMVYLNEKGEIKVAGLPEELWNAPIDQRKSARHYLLNKIDVKRLEVLPETFDDPGVPRSIVVTVKIVKVICRFIYDDEDEQEVMKNWMQIDDLFPKE